MQRLLPFAILVLAAELLALTVLGVRELVTLVPDDSFFYLVIARHLSAGSGFSFDGVHPTYGFQPLWQLCLTPIPALFRGSTSQLLATLVLCSVLHVANGLAIHRLAGALYGRRAAAGSAVFWLLNPAILSWCWGMKENALYALLLVLLLLRGLAWMRGRTRPRDALVLGLLAGLTMLARVNFALLGGALAMGMLLLPAGGTSVGGFRARLRFVLASAAVALLVCAPWALYARSRLGSVMPTSGLVKLEQGRRFVRTELGAGWISPTHLRHALESLPAYLDSTFKVGSGVYGPVLLAVASWLLGCMLFVRRAPDGAPTLRTWRRMDPTAARLLGGLTLIALLNSVTNAVALPSYLAYGQWYTVPEYLLLAIGAGLLVALAAPWVRAARARQMALALTLGACCLAWSMVRQNGWDPHFGDGRRDELGRHPNQSLMELGLWARRHVPEGARVGVWDPGIVTFFSERALISLDPLMNSIEYFERLHKGQLAYAHAEGLSYILGPGVKSDGYLFRRLAPGRYEVIWVPFPDFDLGWAEGEPLYSMLVRPADATGPAFLGTEDFEFGLYLPNRR